jgi:putative nucleotidyltransferase with HDIG domain
LDVGRGWGSSNHLMRVRIEFYVAFVVAAAIGCGLLVYVQDPSVPEGSLAAIALLGGLAVIAEALVFLLPISATGSIAFIPYFATILVAPTWLALVVIAGLRLIADTVARRDAIKTLFNAAQHAFILALAILAYRQLNGVSLLSLRDGTLWQATVQNGGPALLAFAACYFMSGVLVSGAIAISKGLTPVKVWRSNNLATLWLDLLSVPLIFVFAWVYAAFGPIAAAALWVPILGLRQVHKINLELERTNEELLELMVKSMEARDLYTSGHSRRVQHYSSVIARAVGLGEREVNLVSRAALLHDVGKIHEKYGPILLKNDKLNQEEWAIIQEHPVDGASLVATMTRLHELVPPIRHHHENWDGTGYPDGLAGELIPLSARIIRFADTIDAMTTERPYRKPLGEPAVRSEIVRCRGRQFDPEISDKLLSSPLWNQLFRTSDTPHTARPGLKIVGAGKVSASA